LVGVEGDEGRSIDLGAAVDAVLEDAAAWHSGAPGGAAPFRIAATACSGHGLHFVN